MLDELKKRVGTRADIVARTDALYVKKGGKSNPARTKVHVDLTLPVLIVFGAVKKDGDTFSRAYSGHAGH